jgi:epoxyqueuosine reductase QueG
MKSSASTSSRLDYRASGPLDLQIKERARAIGFDLVGITTAQSPQHSEQFQHWLAQEFHGEMGYMARNAHKRVTPTEVLTDARSIVIVGLNYFNNEPTPVPSTGGERGVGSAGRIARYASGQRDYHEVISEKLKQLAAFVCEIGATNTRRFLSATLRSAPALVLSASTPTSSAANSVIGFFSVRC